MHHVPYTHVLHSGKTIIQHIYDVHYQGADEAASFERRWRQLKGLIDEPRYEAVAAHLLYQAGHAIVWRDAINSWFLKTSGIADVNGRAGHFPGRHEAEGMTLTGYAPIDVTPWETAGGGKAVACAGPAACTASFAFEGAPGRYTIIVRYFDENDGQSRFTLRVGRRAIDTLDRRRHLPDEGAKRPFLDVASRPRRRAVGWRNDRRRRHRRRGRARRVGLRRDRQLRRELKFGPYD